MFIGRNQELEQLKQLLAKKVASFVAIYGRRRVGKSSLIEHFANSYPKLMFEGLSPREGISKQDQLDEFSKQLTRQKETKYQHFTDWGDALFALSKYTQHGRIIVAFDEISWMALEDDDFLGKLKIAWDRYFKKNPKLIFIVCGSVSSWIKENIVSSMGMYGRVSLTLNVKELPLDSCSYFWGNLKDKISNAEKLRLLAVTGGIPKYLEEIIPSQTAEDNIRRLAFMSSGILFNDFKEIFTTTLLRKSNYYEKIVRILSNGPAVTADIAKELSIKSGGYLSILLEELTIAGFISKNSNWNLKSKKYSRLSQYRLSDNYLRFYLKYIEPNMERIIAGNFKNRSLSSLPGFTSLMALQIENLVLNNRERIIKLLNIMPDEIICDNPYFQRASAKNKGCQIDYLIHTKYDTLYVCEIKYTHNIIRNYVIDEMEEKIKRLKIPRYTSIRPVLIHLGDIHDEVIDADYFSHIINIGSLLESSS